MEEKTKERLKNLQRENRTRTMRKARFVAAAALLLLAAFSVYRTKQILTGYLWSRPAFRVKNVRVTPEGLEPVVAGIIGVGETNSLLFLDIREVHRKISQLQIVERCRVRKIFPATLEIEITVRKPWVMLPGSPPVFVDRSGAATPAPDDGVLRWCVYGIACSGAAVRPEDADKLRVVAEMEKWYNQFNIGNVFPCTDIDVSEPEKITLKNGSRQVYLVDGNLKEKFADLRTVLRECERRSVEWEYIDLRFKNPYVKKTST